MSTATAISKEDFIKLVVEQFEDHISASDADLMVNGVFGATVKALQQNYKVKFYKFGSFTPSIRPSRIGRNPHTGDSIEIPARGKIKFTPSPILKTGIESALTTKKTAATAKTKQAVKPAEKKAVKKVEKKVEEKKADKAPKGKAVPAKKKSK